MSTFQGAIASCGTCCLSLLCPPPSPPPRQRQRHATTSVTVDWRLCQICCTSLRVPKEIIDSCCFFIAITPYGILSVGNTSQKYSWIASSILSWHNKIMARAKPAILHNNVRYCNLSALAWLMPCWDASDPIRQKPTLIALPRFSTICQRPLPLLRWSTQSAFSISLSK